MKKLYGLACHGTVIMGIMFLVFLVLDQFNPMMDFVDNDISRVLLGLMCLCGISQSILCWRLKQNAEA